MHLECRRNDRTLQPVDCDAAPCRNPSLSLICPKKWELTTCWELYTPALLLVPVQRLNRSSTRSTVPFVDHRRGRAFDGRFNLVRFWTSRAGEWLWPWRHRAQWRSRRKSGELFFLLSSFGSLEWRELSKIPCQLFSFIYWCRFVWLRSNTGMCW